jgi:hypothetical protein
MARQHIHVSGRTTATPEQVYALLTDHTTVPSWSGMDSCELVKPGSPDPEGVGSVRRQRKGRTVGLDTTEELIPGRLFVYSNQGLPVKEYIGRVELTPIEGGCQIDWRSSFLPKYPLTGWLLNSGMKKFLNRCVTGLAEAAARR